MAASILPVLSELTPNSAMQNETIRLTVTGNETHFNEAQIYNTFKLVSPDQTIFGYNLEVINDTTLEADFDCYYYNTPGFYDVKVHNWLDGTMILEDVFTLQADTTAKITLVDPDNADQGETLEITIIGESTVFTSGSATIKFQQGSTTIFPFTQNIFNDTMIAGDFTFELYHPKGYYDVYIYDNRGNWAVSKQDGFYLYPYVSVDPVELLTLGRIYPNPANETLFVERSQENHFGIAIDILNMSGEVIYIDEMTTGQNILKMDISNFESGIYLIKLRCGNQVRIEKIVIR